MKKYAILTVLVLAIMVTVTSCTKSSSSPVVYPERTFRFVLHTEKDFSGNTENIVFSLFIRKANTANTVIFDSTLSPMQIKDIPNASKELVFEKKIADDGSDLTAGFLYAIQNVGNSWYIDTCKSGVSLKVIDYSFQ